MVSESFTSVQVVMAAWQHPVHTGLCSPTSVAWYWAEFRPLLQRVRGLLFCFYVWLSHSVYAGWGQAICSLALLKACIPSGMLVMPGCFPPILCSQHKADLLAHASYWLAISTWVYCSRVSRSADNPHGITECCLSLLLAVCIFVRSCLAVPMLCRRLQPGSAATGLSGRFWVCLCICMSTGVATRPPGLSANRQEVPG